MITADLPLFAQPAVPALHRQRERATSIAAAAAQERKLSSRHQLVLEAFAAHDALGLTDRELEQLPTFALWAPSTARKRRSELFHMGRLVEADRRGGMTVWRLAPEVPRG